MRVLFTTWAWPSHYFPMVPLAWAVRAAGHEVRVVSQPDLLPAMRASGLPSTAVGRDLDVGAKLREARELAADMPVPVRRGRAGGRFTDHLATGLGDDLARLGLVGAFGHLRELEDEATAMFAATMAQRGPDAPRLSLYGEVADAMVDGLLDLATAWRPDLVVFDPLTHAAPVVAKLLGVPAVRNLFGPDVTYFLTAAGLRPVLDRFGLDDVDLNGIASVDPCPTTLQLPHSIAPTNRIRTRYVPYNGIADVPAWLPDRPERRRICLTWGTSTDRRLGEQGFLPGEVLLGCAKLADERDADLVLAIAAGHQRMLPALPGNVRIVESVPLDSLLPTCDALIHQGGAGTMLTAMRHGLPQIVLTQLFDQAVNAFQLATTGAGQIIPAAGLSATDLLAAGHDLLDDPAYRESADALRREILAQPSPAAVVDDLVALA